MISTPILANGFRLCGGQVASQLAPVQSRNAAIMPMPESPGAAQIRLTFENSLGETRSTDCGAVAVAPNWLLTARHCVEDQEWAAFEATIGSQKIGSSRSGVRRTAHAAICPTGTIPGSLEADLALVHLDEPLAQDIEYARLFENPDPAGLNMPVLARLASWPVRQAHIGNPPLRVLPIGLASATPRGHVIASLEDSTQRPPCGGESGAPIYIDVEDGRTRLAGILSAIITPSWAAEELSPKCRSPLTRLMISPVAPWADWVRDTMFLCDARPERCFSRE